MVKTKGIVLKGKNLGNGLRQLTVYSEKLGTVNLLVKTKSLPFPLSVDLFSTSLFTLNQIGERFETEKVILLKHRFPKNLKTFKYRSELCKFISQFPLAGNERLFKLLERYLEIEEKYGLAFTAFLVKFSFVEGIFPSLLKCVKCKKEKEVAGFSLEKGGIVCKDCYEKGREIRWNKETVKLSLTLAKKPFDYLKSLTFSKQQLKKVNLTFKKHVLSCLK